MHDTATPDGKVLNTIMATGRQTSFILATALNLNTETSANNQMMFGI